MTDNVSRALEIVLEVIVTIAIIGFMTAMLVVCRQGYSKLSHDRALRTMMKEQVEFIRYNTDAEVDDIIKFITTYGERFVYVIQKDGYIFTDTAPNEAQINELKSAGLLDSALGWFPVIVHDSVELITLFEDDFVDGSEFEMFGVTYPACERIDIQDATYCRFILVVEK